jgi:hypothetical protein
MHLSDYSLKTTEIFVLLVAHEDILPGRQYSPLPVEQAPPGVLGTGKQHEKYLNVVKLVIGPVKQCF